MGHVQKRQRRRRDGTRYHVWRARTRLAGREVSRTFRRKIDAETWLTTVEGGKLTGTAVDPRRGRITWGEWASVWMRARRASLRPSTVARDESYLTNHLLPRWGDVRLDAIDRSQVVDWVAGLTDQGLAPATARKCVQLLGASLDAAVDDRRLAANPCRKVPLPRDQHREPRFLTAGEVARLAGAIDPRYRSLVLLLGWGGLRIGEAVGLRRADVDLAAGQLRVTRSVAWVRGVPTVQAPKTAAGRRTVGLPRFVVDELRVHMDRHAGPEIVFPSPGGGLLDPNRFRRRQWAPAVDAAGLAPLRIHDLRHTAISLWIAAGADIRRVAGRAGHRSVGFTLSRYGGLYADGEQTLTDALDRLGRGEQP
jgi:integrase